MLTSKSGRNYFIRDGIPRFVGMMLIKNLSNHLAMSGIFNFDQFKTNWLNHTVKTPLALLTFFEER